MVEFCLVDGVLLLVDFLLTFRCAGDLLFKALYANGQFQSSFLTNPLLDIYQFFKYTAVEGGFWLAACTEFLVVVF